MNMIVGASAIVAATPTTGLSAKGPDPIYTAIAAHKVAIEAFRAAVHTSDVLPSVPEFDQAVEAASTAMDDVGCALLDVVPTTHEGMLALLDYARTCDSEELMPCGLLDEDGKERHWSYFVHQNVRAALHAATTPETVPVRRGSRGVDNPEAAPNEADAELIEFAKRLVAVRNRLIQIESVPAYDSGEYQAVYDEGSKLLRRMEQIRPTTLAGFSAKAYAVAWIFFDDPIELGDRQTTDVRLASAILSDLSSQVGRYIA